MARIIADIYSDRRFRVASGGHVSAEHKQHYGISQGCPLSPFLFIIVMTIVVRSLSALLWPSTILLQFRPVHVHGSIPVDVSHLHTVWFMEKTTYIMLSHLLFFLLLYGSTWTLNAGVSHLSAVWLSASLVCICGSIFATHPPAPCYHLRVVCHVQSLPCRTGWYLSWRPVALQVCTFP